MYKKIYLVGAFDRHNYGDILFPLIHSKILTSNGFKEENIKYAAVSASDMRNIGGYQTTSIKSMLSEAHDKNTLIVLCGGDILSADWLLMLGNLSTPLINKAFRAGRKLMGIHITNILAKMLLGQKNFYPYVISKKDTDASIIYTAVGGAGFNRNQKHIETVVNLIQQCVSISVRDQDVKNLLSQNGLNVRLVPDTALPMSVLFPKTHLQTLDWKKPVQTTGNFDFNSYYSFQGAKRLLIEKIPFIVQQIKKVYDTTGYAPLFVPIGRAADHEDHIPLEILFKQLSSEGYSAGILNSEHVMDIMCALALSNGYVGTSLHGAITTYSFGQKVIALKSNGVPKLKDFLKTWVDQRDYYLSSDCEFQKSLIDAITTNKQFHSGEQLKKQISMVLNEISTHELC